MKTFTISSTSNLLEKNNAWNVLLNTVNTENLTFMPFGDISSAFLSHDDSGLISVIFLEDLVKDCLDDFSLVENSIEALLHLVDTRAKKTVQPIILCLASRSRPSAISSAKNDTQLEIFHRKLIIHFTKLRNSFGSVYFLNLDHIFYSKGSEQIYSDRNWYFGRCRLSQDGLSILAKSIAQVVSRTSKPQKKVLVLDCDNTLWGGIIGEDGLQGLVLGQDGLGQAFVDFQKQCLKLSKQGVLLALASKNNEQEVWDVFENHASMVLKREHITNSKINWNEKALNLAELAAELDLGVDSLVFWDDNPIERSKVQAILPEVLVIEAPKNVIEWPNLINNLDCFSTFEVTAEDMQKVDQYRSRAGFVRDSKYADDIASYLKSISLKPKIVPICEANLSRAEQMCRKTNQFNLRSKRYTLAELNSQNSDSNVDMFLVQLSDNYGDHGLIALVGIHYTPINVAFIDTFLMSCRVLGRKLESWILNKVLKLAKLRSVEHLLVDFIDTGRNSIAKDFLLTHGFLPSKRSNQLLQMVNQEILYKPEGFLYELPSIDSEIPNLEIYDGT
jgi:FkbH-like protein